MQQLDEILSRAATADAPVLLRGESGTGKTELARLLHARSLRRTGPFVRVSCLAASNDGLAASLFGRAGAPGAPEGERGRIEAAARGTLFLDEVALLPSALQGRLLRFIQDRRFERLGETETRRADVRLVAASNRPLEQEIAAGRFREDLFFRLNVIEVAVPPLRRRPEDILPLAWHFIDQIARELSRPTPRLSPDSEALLRAHSWPGNLRELRNAIERALLHSPAPHVTPDAFGDLGFASVRASAPGPALGGDFSLEEIERAHIQRVVERAPTLDRAAEILRIDATTLWRKRKRYG